MPFSKYFQQDPPLQDTADYAYLDAAPADDAGLGVDATTFSSQVQFQMPQFMLGGPPTLAYGGGAEVLPVGMVNSPGSLASSWLSNNGFYVDQDSSTASNSQQKYYAAPSYQANQPVHDVQHLQHRQSVASIVIQDRPPPNSGPPSPLLRPSYDPTRQRNNPYSSVPHSVEPLPFEIPAPLASAIGSGLLPSMPLTSSLGIGFPLYSATGFDLLGLLSRVAQRPNPTISLGPVDMTCCFTVVDVRRYDSPIVYASPSFYSLTGYQENEVIGRNCRFLQSPSGRVEKSEERKFTSPDAVAYLKKSLVANKECQTSIVNYRKDGSAFINLVTVIPLYGGMNNYPEERDEVAYHVGFQVDLTDQPNAILQKVRDGTYVVNYSSSTIIPPPAGASVRRVSGVATHALSQELRALLAEKSFVESLPLTTSVNAPPTNPSPVDIRSEANAPHPLNLVVLESSPDFIHVLSLKGSFLYVAPSVRKVLGYEPDELVGKYVSDFCHEADLVPLMRELKESSTGQASSPGDGAGVGSVSGLGMPKMVDLLFRARTKWGTWVWVECRGRLHVEPGKGRKAIVLSGRVREMPRLSWGLIARAGGLVPLPDAEEVKGLSGDKEFWGMLSGGGTFLVLAVAVKDILGWSVGELIGRTIGDLMVSAEGARDEQMVKVLEGAVSRIAHSGRGEPVSVACWMNRKEGGPVQVTVVVYPSQGSWAPIASPLNQSTWATSSGSTSCPVVCQVKIHDGHSGIRSMVHSPSEDVFSELTTATSWQYELQQLKFANQRLMEEMETLEAELNRDDEVSTPTSDSERRDTTGSIHSSSSGSRQSGGVPVAALYEHVRVPSKRGSEVLEDHGEQDYSWNSQMRYQSQHQLYATSGRSLPQQHYTSNVRAEAGHGL